MNALTWLSERAGTEVTRRAPGAGEAESVRTCDDAVARLAAAIEGLAGADAVGFVELRRALKERVAALAATAVAAPEPMPVAEGRAAAVSASPVAPAARVDAPAPAAPPPAGGGGIETREDCQRAVREAGAALRRAAAFLRRQTPSQPSPYRLIRAVTWFEIDALPPNEAGKTRIPSPPPHLRDRCLALASGCAWADLLPEAEARVPEYPFWFDLQRYCAEALAGLGPHHGRALDAVRTEVATLFTRLPGLADLQFNDGVPFADEATRSWLAACVLPVAAPAPAPPAVAIDRADGLDDLRAESRRLVADRQLEAALALLQGAARRAADERTRFLIQFELARTCLDAGLTRAALASFDVLDEQANRFSLDRWEPALAAEVLQVHWRALNEAQRTAKDADLARRIDAVYGRLCALDLVAGLRVRPAGDGRAPTRA
jgi:type VI secretion system protein VasJ